MADLSNVISARGGVEGSVFTTRFTHGFRNPLSIVPVVQGRPLQLTNKVTPSAKFTTNVYIVLRFVWTLHLYLYGRKHAPVAPVPWYLEPGIAMDRFADIVPSANNVSHQDFADHQCSPRSTKASLVSTRTSAWSGLGDCFDSHSYLDYLPYAFLACCADCPLTSSACHFSNPHHNNHRTFS